MSKTKEFRLSYFSCDKSNHQREPLNEICIQKSCKKKGLICSLCRMEHQGHQIVPLKRIYTGISKIILKPLSSDIFQKQLQGIEDCKNNQLYCLKMGVSQIAQIIKELQEQTVENYQKAKTAFFQQIELQNANQSFLEKAFQTEISFDCLKKGFQKIAQTIKVTDDQIFFNYDFCSARLIQIERQNQLESNLKQLTKTILKVKKFQSEIIKPINNNVIEKIICYRGPYKFSQINKSATINIEKEGLIAKQSVTNQSRFVLIENGMNIKQKQIIFKISKLMNWVGIGVAIKSKIISSQYKFLHEAPNHGSYLFSNNGYTWSHSQPAFNCYKIQHEFHQGHQIQVKVNEKQISFYNQQTTARVTLNLHLKPQQWNQLCFCVNLCSQNDTVEIINV